jgi:hypothetical protein
MRIVSTSHMPRIFVDALESVDATITGDEVERGGTQAAEAGHPLDAYPVSAPLAGSSRLSQSISCHPGHRPQWSQCSSGYRPQPHGR